MAKKRLPKTRTGVSKSATCSEELTITEIGEVRPVARCELNADDVLDRVPRDRDDDEACERLAHAERLGRRLQRTPRTSR